MTIAAQERTAKTAYSAVRDAAETIKNDAPATLAGMAPGDVCRQGDCYIVMLDAAPDRAAAYEGRQLAPGTTQGSRHVVDGPCDLYTPQDASALTILARLIPATDGFGQFLGPVILAKGDVTVTHPEHGHRTLPDGIYLVVGQRAFAETLRRAAD